MYIPVRVLIHTGYINIGPKKYSLQIGPGCASIPQRIASVGFSAEDATGLRLPGPRKLTIGTGGILSSCTESPGVSVALGRGGGKEPTLPTRRPVSFC